MFQQVLSSSFQSKYTSQCFSFHGRLSNILFCRHKLPACISHCLPVVVMILQENNSKRHVICVSVNSERLRYISKMQTRSGYCHARPWAEGLHRRLIGVWMYVCHRGYYQGLSRCRLVGSCVLPSENFFTYIKPRLHAWHSHMQSRSQQRFHHFQINERETKKFHFLSFFETLFYTKLPFLLPW